MRVAVVGLGEAGGGLHLPALAELPGIDIVAAVDLDGSRRASAAARFGVPTFSALDAALSSARPEVVVVATPPASHAADALRALEAGAHVLCEKPFAASLAEADQVIRAASAAGKSVALNHQFKEMPIFRAVRDAVGSGARLNFAQVWQLVDLPPQRESGWRGQLLHRGLFEAGVHLVDFAVDLFGEKPVNVEARTSSGGRGGGDAVALVTLEFSRGRLLQITQNRLCKGQRQYFEVRADTDDASVRASFGGRARVLAGLSKSTLPSVRLELGLSGLAWSERGNRRTVLARNPRQPMLAATRSLTERTLAAFKNGGEPPASAESARTVLAVIAAAYHSAETGRRVSLDDAGLAEVRERRLE